MWSVVFVSVRDSLYGSQAADGGPQDDPDDMRPGLFAHIPGMSLSASPACARRLLAVESLCTIDTRLTALSPLTHVSPHPQHDHSGLGPFVAAMKQ